jgi:diphthamide synthase (EF-2-diphthine--ammonia ligase)
MVELMVHSPFHRLMESVASMMGYRRRLDRIDQREARIEAEHARELQALRKQAEEVEALAAAMRGTIDVWLIERGAPPHDHQHYGQHIL